MANNRRVNIDGFSCVVTILTLDNGQVEINVHDYRSFGENNGENIFKF